MMNEIGLYHVWQLVEDERIIVQLFFGTQEQAEQFANHLIHSTEKIHQAYPVGSFYDKYTREEGQRIKARAEGERLGAQLAEQVNNGIVRAEPVYQEMLSYVRLNAEPVEKVSRWAAFSAFCQGVGVPLKAMGNAGFVYASWSDERSNHHPLCIDCADELQIPFWPDTRIIREISRKEHGFVCSECGGDF